MKNIFDILMEKGNPKLAIRYAKRIMKDGLGRTLAEKAAGLCTEKNAAEMLEAVQKGNDDSGHCA